MKRAVLVALVAIVAMGCKPSEFECAEKPLVLDPQPREIGDKQAYRLMYLGEKGLTVTTEPAQVPWFVQHATWVDLGKARPGGVATVVDLANPDAKIHLMKREDAIILAHAGAIGNWAANLAIERSQLMAEASPESDEYTKAAEELGETQDALGEKMSLYMMDRRRRLRTVIWSQPQLKDFVTKPAPKRWFASPECPASADMPKDQGYEMTLVTDGPNERLWKYVSEWAGVKPTLPSVY